MSKYYRGKRSRNIYQPGQDKPFKLSRSRIDLFLNCPRCFYIDRRLGLDRPPGFPFNINSAVDALLKTEFDKYRTLKEPHPLITKNNIDAIPLEHPDMDAWRDSLRRGIQFHHQETNLLITGGVDDVWINKTGESIIVDYKATSKKTEVTIDEDWQIGYRRQMEIYQWLFKKNGHSVNPTGYFVYCNADSEKETFEGKLEFDIKVLPHTGDDSWVEKAVYDAHLCLNQKSIPNPDPDCDYCTYRLEAQKLENIEEASA